MSTREGLPGYGGLRRVVAFDPAADASVGITDSSAPDESRSYFGVGAASLKPVGGLSRVGQPVDWWTRLFDQKMRSVTPSPSGTRGASHPTVSAGNLSAIVRSSDPVRPEPVSIRSFDVDSFPPSFFLYVYVTSAEDADRFLRLGYVPTRIVGWLWENVSDTPPGPIGALYRFFAVGTFLYTTEWSLARYFEKLGLRSQMSFGEAPRFMLPPQAPYSMRRELELTEVFVSMPRGGLSTQLMEWTEVVKWREQLSVESPLGWVLKSWQRGTQPLIELRRLRPILVEDDGYIGGGGFDLPGAISSAWRQFVKWYLETLAKKGDKLTEAMLSDALGGSWYPTPSGDDLSDHLEDVIKDLYDEAREKIRKG